MDRFVQLLRAELDSYHIDEDDLQSNIMQICKKHDIHYQNEYDYKHGTEFHTHSGDFIITRGNKHYILETKITYSPNWKNGAIENIKMKNARKRLVDRQCVKYTICTITMLKIVIVIGTVYITGNSCYRRRSRSCLLS